MYSKTVVALPLILVAFLQPVQSFWSEFEILALKPMNTTDSKPMEFDLQLKRIKKGVFGISGAIKMIDTLPDYTGELILLHSPARNNDFKLMPAKIQEGPSCDKTNNEYRRYIMKDLHKVSDLPYTEDSSANICDMFTKGSTYTLKHYEFDKQVVPQFLQPGYYRALIKFMKDGVVYGGLDVLADLS